MEKQNQKNQKDKKENPSSKHMSIRSILGGDILAKSETGSGKTLLAKTHFAPI